MTQNLELAVHTFPGRRPVLLIHGFTRSAELDWIEPGWPTALAAQGRGTIAVDLPGHGSCPPADSDAVSVNAIIAAMVAAIDGTGQELADVIGYSLGARLAWSLAATGRVGHLVLGGLSPTDPISGVDIELVGAVARGDEEASDPKIRGWQPGSHYLGLNGNRRCCSSRRWAPSRSNRASTFRGRRHWSSRGLRTTLVRT